MPEPFSYTRATIDDLKRSVSRIAYVLGIVISSLSIAYYVYAIVIQASKGYWILFGVDISITAISLVLLGFYIFKRKLTNGFEKKWGYDRMHAILSWCLIGLRAIVLAFAIAEAFLSGVTNVGLLLLVFTALLWVVQIVTELIKAYVLHYLALFTLAFEKDKATLADDLVGTAKSFIGDKVKEKIGEKLHFSRHKKEEDPPAELVPEQGKHKKKYRTLLEKIHDEHLRRKKKVGKAPAYPQSNDDEVEPMEIEAPDSKEK